MTAIQAWMPHLSIATCVWALDMSRPSTFTVDTAPTPDTVTAFTNLKTGTSWTEATNPPDLGSINNQPAMVGNGSSKHVTSTEASVLAAFTGTDTPMSVILVTQPVTADAATAFLCSGNSATAQTSTKRFGTAVTGNGRWTMVTIDSAGGNASGVGDTDLTTTGQVAAWVFTGTAVSIWKNLTLQLNAAAHDVAAVNSDRVSLFQRPDSAPDSFSDGKISAGYIDTAAISASTRLRVTSRYMLQFGIWP